MEKELTFLNHVAKLRIPHYVVPHQTPLLGRNKDLSFQVRTQKIVQKRSTGISQYHRSCVMLTAVTGLGRSSLETGNSGTGRRKYKQRRTRSLITETSRYLFARGTFDSVYGSDLHQQLMLVGRRRS